MDTTCAIVGGIVAAHVGTEGIPAQWREATEALPGWVREDQLGADVGPADFPRQASTGLADAGLLQEPPGEVGGAGAR